MAGILRVQGIITCSVTYNREIEVLPAARIITVVQALPTAGLREECQEAVEAGDKQEEKQDAIQDTGNWILKIQ